VRIPCHPPVLPGVRRDSASEDIGSVQRAVSHECSLPSKEIKLLLWRRSRIRDVEKDSYSYVIVHRLQSKD
jgi:hypothetical protein